MKYIILFLLINSSCFSQKNDLKHFEKNYNQLVEYLSSENWPKAEKLSKQLLETVEAVDSMQTEKMVLRYIYVYANAGLLNQKKISKDQALKNVGFLQSTEMILPAHPFNSACYVNCTHLAEDSANTFFTGVNNAAGTQIFSFEYVQIENGIKESKKELEGKYVTLKGVLDEISVEGNMFPRFKLRFSHGDYRIE